MRKKNITPISKANHHSTEHNEVIRPHPIQLKYCSFHVSQLMRYARACSLFLVPCYDIRYDFRIETIFGWSLPLVVCRRAHVLLTLCVLVCIQWCPTHIVLCFCFVLLRLVYPVLPVSLDCPFQIAPLVFSYVYLTTSPYSEYKTVKPRIIFGFVSNVTS